jgi:hypothetical protein
MYLMHSRPYECLAVVRTNYEKESEVIVMTVQSDLQKAIASCEAAKGSYAMMAQSTEDQHAKQTYNVMKADIERHIQFLNSRMGYLNSNSTINQKQQKQ